jgi:NADH-quinone oxidoreductase subunit N
MWMASANHLLALVIGNLAALPQRNFKRLLAYSSIAHVGFLLMAVAASPESGAERSLLATPAGACAFYLGTYLLMTFLAFLVMSVCRGKVGNEDLVDSYAGLARRSPFLAFSMLVAMASLAGIPLTAGFFGKLFVFKLVVEQGQWFLLAVGLVGAATGFYYYLKIAASMYLSEPSGGKDAESIAIGILPRAAIVAPVVAILAVGVMPGLMSGLFA